MRLAQTQVWPMLRYFETMAPSTAASISASSNTTNGALPVRILNTPLGTPAFSASATNASAVSGVSLAVLITTVQPAASAGDTLRVIIEHGKFHGVIAPQTPIGCLIASSRASGRCVGMVSP